MLSRDTHLHLVIIQFRGPRLLRLDESQSSTYSEGQA